MTEREEAIARSVGRYVGANARIIASLIAVLIKHGVISAEAIEEDFLNHAQYALEPLVLSTDQEIENEPDASFEASQCAKSELQLLDEIRKMLFPHGGG